MLMSWLANGAGSRPDQEEERVALAVEEEVAKEVYMVESTSCDTM